MLNALVLDPELQSRLNFKQLAREVGLYGDVHFAGTLREGVERLNNTREYDLLYVSTRFDIEIVREFIPAAKRTPRGADAAYLLLVRNAHNDSKMLASAMACGADGFLVEPYSVEGLTECTKIAVKVRKQRLDARYRKATALLAGNAIKLTDQAWLELKAGRSTAAITRHLQEIRRDVMALPPEFRPLFHEQLADLTADLPPPTLPSQMGAYTGVSKRLRSRLVKKGI